MTHSTIGFIGLGKMGHNMILRLKDKSVATVVFDGSEEVRGRAKEVGLETADSMVALVQILNTPRTIILMVPHGAVDEVFEALMPHLESGDTIIDGGNSFYGDSIRRSGVCKERHIHFLDMGVSGGPGGARAGACIMVGGDRDVFIAHEPLFRALATENGYAYVGAAGAGHFVKMVHNGIEYGMMEALAEGFTLMKKAPFDLELQKIAMLFNHGSVIESRLVAYLADGFGEFGEDLLGATSTVAMSGEGEWTIDTAKNMNVPVPAIEASVHVRKGSGQNPSFAGKILSVLRNRFGGHKVDNF